MNRARPKAIASRARAAVIAQRDLDWQALADAWSVVYRQTGDIETALRRTFEIARSGPAQDTYPWADAVVAAVARRHDVTVDALVFGGRELAELRFEAFFLLGLRKMPDHAIARLFHVVPRSVLRGRRAFGRSLAGSSELRAQVGWLVNSLEKGKVAV